MYRTLGIEPMPRIELPLWGNVIALLVVAFLLGVIVCDIIRLYLINREKK